MHAGSGSGPASRLSPIGAESPEELGTHLKLPPWLEPRRERLEARLPELRLPVPSR